jgi:hypothetical protein
MNERTDGHRDDHPGTTGDREAWARLDTLLSECPVLTKVSEQGFGGTHVTRAATAHRVRQVDEFAGRVRQELLPPWAPVHPGSARAVARSVVGVCRAFVLEWSSQPAPTATRLHDFNRDLDIVATMFDAVTFRPQPRVDGPDDPHRPAGLVAA